MTQSNESADQQKQRSRGWSDEMDAPSIARRLKAVDDLYAAWLVLKQARRVEPTESSVFDEHSSVELVQRSRTTGFT